MRLFRRRVDRQIEGLAEKIAEITTDELRESLVEKREHEQAMEEIDRRLERVRSVWEALRPEEDP